jgi:glycosyltransferase involved in cell wall biosynthesis
VTVAVRGSAPAVSVLMTAYNRAAFIDAAIGSVRAQTFTDFELVIVDDGSSDDTVKRARAHAAADGRIRVEVNERNLGDYPNRNRAAALARGRLLKYHDSDDLMYPHCLEIMVAALAAEPAAGMALSRGAFWPGAPAPMLLTPRMAFQREFLGSRMFMCGPGGALMRAEVFRELGGFEDFGSPSDYVFWLKACARVPVVLAPADLFWYRTHAGQVLRNPRSVREMARAASIAWRALHTDECPLTPAEREVARRNQAWDVAREAGRSLRAGDVALAWYRVAHAGLTPGEWLRYLRLPARDPLAGTPRDAGSDSLIPAAR